MKPELSDILKPTLNAGKEGKTSLRVRVFCVIFKEVLEILDQLDPELSHVEVYKLGPESKEVWDGPWNYRVEFFK